MTDTKAKYHLGDYVAAGICGTGGLVVLLVLGAEVAGLDAVSRLLGAGVPVLTVPGLVALSGMAAIFLLIRKARQTAFSAREKATLRRWRLDPSLMPAHTKRHRSIAQVLVWAGGAGSLTLSALGLGLLPSPPQLTAPLQSLASDAFLYAAAFLGVASMFLAPILVATLLGRGVLVGNAVYWVASCLHRDGFWELFAHLDDLGTSLSLPGYFVVPGFYFAAAVLLDRERGELRAAQQGDAPDEERKEGTE